MATQRITRDMIPVVEPNFPRDCCQQIFISWETWANILKAAIIVLAGLVGTVAGLSWMGANEFSNVKNQLEDHSVRITSVEKQVALPDSLVSMIYEMHAKIMRLK